MPNGANTYTWIHYFERDLSHDDRQAWLETARGEADWLTCSAIEDGYRFTFDTAEEQYRFLKYSYENGLAENWPDRSSRYQPRFRAYRELCELESFFYVMEVDDRNIPLEAAINACYYSFQEPRPHVGRFYPLRYQPSGETVTHRFDFDANHVFIAPHTAQPIDYAKFVEIHLLMAGVEYEYSVDEKSMTFTFDKNCLPAFENIHWGINRFMKAKQDLETAEAEQHHNPAQSQEEWTFTLG